MEADMSNFDFKPAGDSDTNRQAHRVSDVDADRQALHHTLGKGSTQASPGNHNHNADYSGISHDHDTDYSDITHNHDTEYALVDHNHDADYAAIDHTHSGALDEVVECTATTSTSSTAVTAVTGLTNDIDVTTGDIYEVTAHLDITCSTSGTTIMFAMLYIEGVQYVNPALSFDELIYRAANTTHRQTVTYKWKVEGLTTAAAQTFEIRVKSNGTASTHGVNSPRSNMRIRRLEPVG
jgi:hypothetical protein